MWEVGIGGQKLWEVVDWGSKIVGGGRLWAKICGRWEIGIPVSPPLIITFSFMKTFNTVYFIPCTYICFVIRCSLLECWCM